MVSLTFIAASLGTHVRSVNRSAQAMLRTLYSRRAAPLGVHRKRLWNTGFAMITLLIIFLIALVLVAGYLLFFAH
jgi:hypothetical protein